MGEPSSPPQFTYLHLVEERRMRTENFKVSDFIIFSPEKWGIESFRFSNSGFNNPGNPIYPSSPHSGTWLLLQQTPWMCVLALPILGEDQP